MRWISRMPQLLSNTDQAVVPDVYQLPAITQLKMGSSLLGKEGWVAQGPAVHNLVYKKALTMTISDEC